jgi:glutamate dehydrogenase/leucine dehydrogenase
MENIHLDAFENAKTQLTSAYALYNKGSIETNDLNILSVPKRIIEVQIPVKMDNGSVRMFQAFRSQHNNSRGPFK